MGKQQQEGGRHTCLNAYSLSDGRLVLAEHVHVMLHSATSEAVHTLAPVDAMPPGMLHHPCVDGTCKHRKVAGLIEGRASWV